MSRRRRIKGRATDEAFQEQCFLWEKRVPLAIDFGLLLCAQEPIEHNKKLTTTFF